MHYPNIRRLMKHFDDLVTGMRYQQSLPAILDTLDSDDQTAQRAPSLMKRVIRTTQSFFVGTPNSAHRSSSRDSHVREHSSHALAIQDDVIDIAIMNHTTSHSSPPSLASQMFVNTPTRRFRGNS